MRRLIPVCLIALAACASAPTVLYPHYPDAPAVRRVVWMDGGDVDIVCSKYVKVEDDGSLPSWDESYCGCWVGPQGTIYASRQCPHKEIIAHEKCHARGKLTPAECESDFPVHAMQGIDVEYDGARDAGGGSD